VGQWGKMRGDNGVKQEKVKNRIKKLLFAEGTRKGNNIYNN
jgi:hypothetical protein